MKSFLNYITEEAQAGAKLKHLDHPEDNAITQGKQGFEHAFNALKQVHKAVTGKQHDVNISTKLDGSPSVVFGHHPETKQFFVASKSAFGKTPKINYTHEDVERNHGHSPGLAKKLHQALNHLPKITPRTGVYQGDFMHSHDEMEHSDHKISFKPNTITYSLNRGSPEGRKAANSKMGIAIHTKYEGSDFNSMHATPNVDHENFRKHRDVHVISTEAKL